MKHYIQAITTFITGHKKKFILGTEIALGALALAIVAMLFVYNMPKDTYAAIAACDLFTPAEAQDLLGDKVISVDTKAPAISDNTSVSKCSYTDSNSNKNKMMIAAIAVRAGINGKGIKQNKADFASKKSNKSTETVKNLGDSAYFDKELGQLNILKGREWIILSYGVGSTPQANTLDKATELAKKVLN